MVKLGRINGLKRNLKLKFYWVMVQRLFTKKITASSKWMLQRSCGQRATLENIKEDTSISEDGETIVDMFAGIGYFSIPMAVHSKPAKIYSVEINPVSYSYLCQNTVLNKVEDIVEPILGDCRETAPRELQTGF